MKRFKLQRLTAITAPILIILIVLCAFSLVILSINGIRPGLFSSATDKDFVDSPAYLAPTVDFGEYYVNDIVYLCDSTLARMADEGVLRDGESTNQIWTGVDGDLPLAANTVKSELFFPDSKEQAYISEAAALKRPDYLIIALGIKNGVRYCTEEQFKSYYKAVVEEIKAASPDTKIILQSVLPVSRGYEFRTQGISLEKIDRANGWIIELAEELDLKYLNTASALSDDRGYLKKEYDSGDGLHPNADGYNAILNYIRTHGYYPPATSLPSDDSEESATEDDLT